MPWFYVKEVENGAVLNYQIKDHLVEVRSADDLAVLRKEPERFKELTKREVAAHKKAATGSSVSEDVEEPEENDGDTIDSEDFAEKTEEPAEDVDDSEDSVEDSEPIEEKPKKKKKVVKKKKKK